MSYGIGGCCPQCGGEPMTAGFAHRAECPTLRTNAVYPVGDRSLLRAPTPTEKAKLAAWDAYCEDQTLDLNQDIARAVDRAVEAAYAVDGLRGTEPRKRNVFCIWCGEWEPLAAAGDPNDEATVRAVYEAAKAHDVTCPKNPLVRELAALRSTVGAEDRALREALEPFAKFAEIVKLETRPDLMDTERFVCSFCWGTDENGEHRGEATFTYGDLRRAARVLRESVEGEQRAGGSHGGD